MCGEPARYCVDQRPLKIEGRLVSKDPTLPEPLEHGADVLMLVFDRTPRSSDKRLQPPVVLRFRIGAPGLVIGEHGEIVGNDRVVLIIGPIAAHKARIKNTADPVTVRPHILRTRY